VATGIARTGEVGLLEGARPGPVIMARFDMDALPIAEENAVEYASRHPGVMHACGHDAHMAMGLGVATIMARYQDRMAGVLKLVFQPGEEGLNGALLMVEEGVLENPRPDVVLAVHVWNDMPVGMVSVTAGAVMAAADKWTCLVTGVGGHGALPHQAKDPIVVAAHIVTALQTIVSRNINPLETAVVSVGSLHGGDAFNIIPAQVELRGTIRAYSPQVQELARQRLREIVAGIAQAYAVDASLEIAPLTPPLINDERVVEVVRTAAGAVVGPEHVISGLRTMGSEDAAFFLEKVPGCYLFLGSARAEAEVAPHHSPRFEIDEDVLPIGVAILVHTLAHYLLQ
ncbi:MAG: M20 family metallopeptidase, partial [Anaerolineae bacterium]|nr:M20 family metallopeptidase [Anaerolineae bacterium]